MFYDVPLGDKTGFDHCFGVCIMFAMYLRRSTCKQELTLSQQEERIYKYLASRGVGECIVYREDSVSGKVPLSRRPEGRRLVDDIYSGKIQCVVSCKLDRLFRSTVDCLSTIQEWSKYDVKLSILDCAGAELRTDTPFGHFTLSIISAMATLEGRLISARTSDAMRELQRKGVWLGKAPFGFRYNKKKRALVPDRREQKVISMIKELRSSGMTFREISLTLKKSKVYGRTKGKFMSYSQVCKIYRRTRRV